MRSDRRALIPALVLMAAPSAPAVAQQTATFHHSGQPMSIEASAEWSAGAWPGDPGVYEVSAPDGSMRVLLWFSQNEQGAHGYLRKMLGMKPLEPTGEPFRTTIGGREAWRAVATGAEQGDENVTETFAVVGVDIGTPAGGNYVLQVWCPSGQATEFGSLIESIVSSLRVDKAAG